MDSQHAIVMMQSIACEREVKLIKVDCSPRADGSGGATMRHFLRNCHTQIYSRSGEDQADGGDGGNDGSGRATI
jgi:hypothetical protein